MSAGPLQGPHLLVVYMWGPTLHQVQEDLLTQDPKARVAAGSALKGYIILPGPIYTSGRQAGRQARTVLSGELVSQ